jgi:hypothetical protein
MERRRLADKSGPWRRCAGSAVSLVMIGFTGWCLPWWIEIPLVAAAVHFSPT